MTFLGRTHPLLIHFPIALVLAAVAAEAVATATADDRWRIVAVANTRVGAAFAVIAAITGWRLALTSSIDSTSLLVWHRWLGTAGAAICVATASATWIGDGRSRTTLSVYRVALFTAATLVAITGHLGGLMVWGADFLRP